METPASRETRQLFDLMVKCLLKDISSGTVIHWINGLFGTAYPPNSAVRFGKTEAVNRRGQKLVKLQADLIMSISIETEATEWDDYVVEAQIENDETMGLRIFEYGFAYAHETKQIHDQGRLIEMTIPQGCVIYWECTKNTPDYIILRLRSKKDRSRYFDYEVEVFKMPEQSLEELEAKKLLVLLPFCLVRFRKEVKKGNLPAEERKALAEQERALIEALEGMLRRGEEAGIIPSADSLVVMEQIQRMHQELYGNYPEFKEVQMVLEEQLRSKWRIHERELSSQWKAHERELVSQWKAQEQKAVQQTEAKIIGLFRQGYSLEEVEKLLAAEAAATPDTAPQADAAPPPSP